MSENVFGADNQQGRLQLNIEEPSETTRQTPTMWDEDIVHAL